MAVAPAAIGSFMLPVGTPPNAIVYASARVTIGCRMGRTGIVLNLIGVAVVTTGVTPADLITGI